MGIPAGIFEFAYAATASNFEEAFGNSMLGFIKPFLYVTDATGRGSKELIAIFSDGGIVHTIFEALEFFGMGMVVIYFFLYFFDEMQRHFQFQIENFYRIFAQFGIAFLIVTNAFPIVQGMAKLGDAATGIIEDSVAESPNTKETLESIAESYCLIFGSYDSSTGKVTIDSSEDAIDDAYEKYGDNDGWGEWSLAGQMIMNMLETWVLKLFGMIVSVIAATTAATRFIQLAMYMAFAPIPLASVFGQGQTSQAIRYIKKVFAVALQGALLMGVVSMQPYLTTATNMMGGLKVVGYIIVNLAILGTLKQVEKFSNEIVM